MKTKEQIAAHQLIIKDIWTAYYQGFLKREEALKEIKIENWAYNKEEEN